MFTLKVFRKIHDWLWEIPRSFRGDMRVSARVYATEAMLEDLLRDRSMDQLTNIATLPGIQKYALAMPDAHEGYGFPIGGVAAFDLSEGVISPGGIGFDINCAIRFLASDRTFLEIEDYIDDLGQAMFREVPSGVGKGGRLTVKGADFDRVLENGAERMIGMGYGEREDLSHIESEGKLEGADSRCVGNQAKSRGADQLGTLGAGNHFVEIDVVETVFDEKVARRFGLFMGQVVVLIHTGSRGLGHQVATDYIKTMLGVMPRYGIEVPDRDLACAPFQSDEGQAYFSAMACSANFAWANRQLITWEVRKAWEDVLGVKDGELRLVYDVAHNIAKIERYGNQEFLVHRKGATRAFPGQPVIIPGSMGTASYVLLGQKASLTQSFGSTCHGAGRRMSRSQALRTIRGDELRDRLEEHGISVHTASIRGLAEEAPEAYKDVDSVVSVVHEAGIAKKVARLKPVAVVKG